MFKPGMTWQNYGSRGWHIDHILPIASFDLLNEDELFKAFNFRNLQPLWWFENLSKGRSMPETNVYDSSFILPK
jgi:hypothetical protein